MEKIFTKVRSAKDIIKSSSLIIAGCILAILPLGTGINLGGAVLIISGIILALSLKSAYKDDKSQKTYSKKEFFFKQEEKSSILNKISASPDSISLSEEGKGQALRLDIYYCKSSGEGYIQLYEYIPHQYRSCSKLYAYDTSKLKPFIS
ncbi:MAG: hypothetical protein IKY70_02575 [Bacteroidales bacterium]|nr:hypothetical protein [Bacteroidales bacterium]